MERTKRAGATGLAVLALSLLMLATVGAPTAPAKGKPVSQKQFKALKKLTQKLAAELAVLKGKGSPSPGASPAPGSTTSPSTGTKKEEQTPVVLPTTLPPSGPAGGDLTGAFPAPQLGLGVVGSGELADGSVTAAKLGAGSVTGVALANGSVTDPSLAAGAVTSRTIFDGTILTADLAANAVSGANIADGTVGLVDLGDDAVKSSTIVNGAIASDDIGDEAVSTDGILNGTILADDLSANAVSGGSIVDESITANDLAGNAVGSPEILNGSVGTADLGTGSVHADDLAELKVFFGDPALISPGAAGVQTLFATCPTGTRLISGGYKWANVPGQTEILVNMPNGTSATRTWQVTGRTNATANTLTPSVVCLVE